jgi:signal transduction histidine kinase
VHISTRHADERIEIHVTDDGAGLSKEFAAHAFERFRRGNHTHSGDGAGLGLAIVDAVAHAHNGSTGAEGADVWMSLPA